MTTSTSSEENKDEVGVGVGAVAPTEMIYYSYEGNFQLECDAKVLSCKFIEKDDGNGNENNSRMVELMLDKTVLHAQGGGQPTDTGVIQLSNGDATMNVSKVLLDRSTKVAIHSGTMTITGTPDTVSVGEQVHVVVDQPNRQILSECHTAGHVVDSAMARCGSILPSLKGYHFLEGPYVEYKGKIPPEERDALVEKLQAAFQDLLEENIDTEIQVLTKEKAEEVCNRVAENYFNLSQFGDDGDPVRIVTVAGWPCPCGGTHVQSTGQLNKNNWGITGIRCKKGVVRIKYNQNWDSL